MADRYSQAAFDKLRDEYNKTLTDSGDGDVFLYSYEASAGGRYYVFGETRSCIGRQDAMNHMWTKLAELAHKAL